MDDKRQSSPPEGEPNEPNNEPNKDDGSARERLLEAATKLFAANGLEGTSTRDIAKAAEVNISLISYYFGGKEGLYKAVIFEFATQTAARVGNSLQGLDLSNLTAETFKKRMHSFLSGMLPIKLASRDIHLILQREMLAGLPHAKEVYENVFSKILESVVEVYKAGQKKGFIRDDINPYILFFSMVHSTDVYMQMCRCETQVQGKILKLPDQMDEYINQVYRIFVEGVLV